MFHGGCYSKRMKPSFALTLSFEGIDLLHRAPDGWRAVGSVPFESEDLGAALSNLREQALTLSPDGVTSKLILPEDQIKYVTVPVNGTAMDGFESLAHRALEGATPYELDDLAIDWRQNGADLEIAAVARETLAEAEAFAHEHQFNPVSFVGQPEGGFPGEPFFGGTHAATELFGGPVQPDEDAVAVVGPAKFPAPEPIPEPEPVTAPLVETVSAPVVEEAVEPVAPPAPEPTPEPAPASVAAAEPAPVTPEPVAAPVVETIAAPVVAAPEASSEPAPVAPKSVDYEQMALDIENELGPAAELTPEELELIEAAEKRGNVEAAPDPVEAALKADLPDLKLDQPPAPAPVAPPAEPDLPPLFTHQATPEGEPAPSAPQEEDTPAPAEGGFSFSSVRARRSNDAEDLPPSAAPALDGASRAGAFESVRKLTLRPDKKAQPDAKAPNKKTPAKTEPPIAAPSKKDQALPDDPAIATPQVDVNAPVVPLGEGDLTIAAANEAEAEAAMREAAASSLTAEAPLDDIVTAPDVAAPATAPTGKSKPSKATKKQAAKREKQRMTVFGARPAEEEVVVGGKPKFLGLILTALLLLFLVGMAAWASLGEDGLANLFRAAPETTEEVLQAEAEPAPVIEAPEPVTLAAVPTVTEGTDNTVAEVTPAENALTDVDLPAVEGTAVEAAPETAEIASLPTELQFEPEAPATETPDATSRAPTLDPVLNPDLDAELEAEPEVAQLPQLSRDQQMTTAERYAASGIWQDAPAQPDVPEGAQLDDFYIASIDPKVPSFDAVALPDARRVQSDTTPPAQNVPAAAGTEFAFDQRGLVTATPEGAMTPDGILVFKGRPPVRPSAFPARAIVAPDGISEEELLQRAKIRPRARPADLIESNERSVLGGRTRTELAALRPKARPELTADEQDQNRLALLNSASAPLVDLSGETRNAINGAVAQSVLKPRARPADLNTNVTEEVQVASARVQPQLPTSASVARQATAKNQLNLRKVNLIGVFGQSSDRKALVRLSSGRYKKVGVGDRIDGGRVASISKTELRYTKSGRTITLKMPRG